MGHNPESISPHYEYSLHPSKKADLLIKDNEHNIIFGLKSFVIHQGSNKNIKFPMQIKWLNDEIENEFVDQVVAFATFIGYTQRAMDNWKKRLDDWLEKPKFWTKSGPKKLLKRYDLYYWIASRQ